MYIERKEEFSFRSHRYTFQKYKNINVWEKKYKPFCFFLSFFFYF